jgi:hypothetical protein
MVGDCIVANDAVCQKTSIMACTLAADYGPKRSNSDRLAGSCLTASLRRKKNRKAKKHGHIPFREFAVPQSDSLEAMRVCLYTPSLRQCLPPLTF